MLTENGFSGVVTSLAADLLGQNKIKLFHGIKKSDNIMTGGRKVFKSGNLVS